MGFFATFWAWLQGQLATYVGDNAARVASALEPAAVSLATVYVMAWGWLHLTGRIEQPFVEGLKRIATVAVVLGVALRLWLYNDVLADAFYRAPAELAAAVVGARDPVATLDAIWERGGAVAGILWERAAWLPGGWGFAIAGAAVWLVIGLVCVYTMFLIALSSVAIALLLALGPPFVVATLFERSRRLFEAWLAQLATYALVTVLTVLLAALLLQLVASYAEQSAARGAALTTVDALDMLLAAGVVLLVMRQVMPIAGGLGGGVALGSYGIVSRIAGWPLRRVLR